jgi:hypothetical protein
LDEEGTCLLLPQTAALDAEGTNAMLLHPNVIIAQNIVRKKDLILNEQEGRKVKERGGNRR